MTKDTVITQLEAIVTINLLACHTEQFKITFTTLNLSQMAKRWPKRGLDLLASV